jgi:hypothetical protein
MLWRMVVVPIGCWWRWRWHRMGVSMGRWCVHTRRVIIPRVHMRRRRIVWVHGHRRGLVREMRGYLLMLVMPRIWIIHLLLHGGWRRCTPSLIRVGRIMRMCRWRRRMVLVCKVRRWVGAWWRVLRLWCRWWWCRVLSLVIMVTPYSSCAVCSGSIIHGSRSYSHRISIPRCHSAGRMWMGDRARWADAAGWMRRYHLRCRCCRCCR